MNTLIDKDDVTVSLNSTFLSEAEADALQQAIVSQVTFSPEAAIFGNVPKRQSCAYGDDGLTYRYSRTTRKATPWFPELLALKVRLEEYLKAQGINDTYNFALINYYPDGSAQIPWHADNERDLNPQMGISSISLGAVRKFKLKENATKKTTDVLLPHGSLLHMGIGTQDKYQHAMLKTTTVSTPRYNITFRSIV